ncbi:uncharacterized protein [Physcomitrium patens]|uniref:Uncharacterized protein n=1 Tax=Physcomitrium patens TaxID=3218 RepID=A0A7I4AFE2_PHYPA
MGLRVASGMADLCIVSVARSSLVAVKRAEVGSCFVDEVHFSRTLDLPGAVGSHWGRSSHHYFVHCCQQSLCFKNGRNGDWAVLVLFEQQISWLF